jgi:adenine/guanine phosphoribosyltransferase-like PRPP-binding protein
MSDDVLYIASVDPVGLEHIHGGSHVAFVTDVIGTEASAEGVRELVEHKCPECGAQLVVALAIHAEGA